MNIGFRFVYGVPADTNNSIEYTLAMPTCPFCNIEISEELSLYGGYCTSCLIEIPGEEAETDPGVSADAAVQKETNKSFLIPFVAVLVLGIGFLGFQSMSGDPESDESRAVGFRPAVPLSAHQDQKYEHEEVAKKSDEAASKEKKRRKTRRRTSGAASSAAAAPLPTAETNDGDAKTGLGSAPTDMFSSIGAAPRSRGGPQGIVLTDAVKIEEMVARVLIRGRRDVNACFATAKAADPGASGAWYVAFTVGKDGRPVGIGMERLSNKNSAVEACIQGAVSEWRFQRVAEEVQVSDTFRMSG